MSQRDIRERTMVGEREGQMWLRAFSVVGFVFFFFFEQARHGRQVRIGQFE